ncbi:MAG TPA: TolC family protein [Candidatus Limnocylindria bacterium]|nr:TolC family protein [Candidatus Limnocylindria bacterium]
MKVSTHCLGCWYLAAVTVLGVGCSANYYRKSADKDVYKSIAQRTPAVPNMDTNFTIEQTNVLSLERLPVTTNTFDFLGADAERELAARVLSLEDALIIAIQHNRAYQLRKEQLYLTALNLTLARYRFTPIFSGGARARIIGQTEQAVRVDIDPVTQLPRVVLSDDLVEQRRVAADGNLNVSWLIRDIGLLTASISADFLRYVTGDPRAFTSSQAGAALSRPLLRNAGFKLQIEQLTQAERDLLYDLRAFVQFRKTFSVQVASVYYAVLGNRDFVRNNYLNLLSSRLNADRTRELAREGRVTQADLGRLEQQVLTAESAWNNAVRAYKQALDIFKLQQLGIAVDTRLVLDDAELTALEIHDPRIQADDAVEVALAARLDYLNSKDRYQDSLRKVELAANFLKPQVDLVSSVAIRSEPNQRTGFPVPDIERYNWSAGFNVDVPFDRQAERNTYRTSLIGKEQAVRALEQQGDEIRLEVRDGARTLDQAKRSFEISQLGVQLAERRVEEQNLLAEVGRAKAQDQVDAQNDLITSKNQLTVALVAHTIARLQFWANMGILYIKDNGQWRELNDEQAP